MANNKGWIKIWRKVINNEFCKGDMRKLGFWIWCLSKCVTEEGDYPVGNQMVHLKPGQFVFGRRKAAQETGLSENTISGWLSQAQIMAQVDTHVVAHRYTIVEVLNWGYYQGQTNSCTQPSTQVYTQTTNTIKEGKKNKKNNKNSLSKEREKKEEGNWEKLEEISTPLNSYERWLLEQEQENDSI